MVKQFSIFFLLLLLSCKNRDFEPITSPSLYFPSGSTWDTNSIDNLGWNQSATDDLYSFLSENGTRGFILLKDGKIVIEKYWGNTLEGNSIFDQNSFWYWASAGKTLTSFLVGIAQEKGLIDINNKTSDYLGEGWTSMPAEKEDLILIRHQLTMTTGLDYQVPNPDCTSSGCLKYKSDPENQWFYHNAPYTLLESVISNAAGQSYNSFTDENIEAQIGMSGIWLNLGDNNVYTSTTRDAAKFGLLMLNKGTWNNDMVLGDKNYFNAMINSSQTLNSSYGYLTWLNGKSNIVYPGIPNQFNGSLSINAPSDLYAAMGKNGQFIDVVPSQQLVVVRFGESPDNSLVPVSYHNEMWAKINALIN